MKPATNAAQNRRAYVERRKARGDRLLQVWVTPRTLALLHALAGGGKMEPVIATLAETHATELTIEGE